MRNYRLIVAVGSTTISVMRVKHYTIEAPGRDAEQVRGTAKAAMRRVQELHRAGVKATLKRTTRAQLRALAA